ncbi:MULTISPECIES: MFS transporter [Arthrobacter]|uniref:MFS transporter n=1 Tax=Arthrobacter terricola TaxID=2547396 RepID=A0A4R5KEI3_9MICC|nr:MULTISPECIES: MFS transporter [Arthrobacter]MBT8159684.1 MFS transporter [Arthrobacter sp. GN70]TDF93636.1 MFS transporter [Arthrobacter terricola]
MNKPVERVEPVEEQGRTGTVSTALLLTGVLLLAANLRPSIAVLGPVLGQVRLALNLTGGETSLLAALPVLIFGAFAPAGPILIRRMGTHSTVLTALSVMTLGAVVRLAPGWPALLAGTCILSAGIAVGNVLLPVLAKTHFAARIGTVTGLSTMSLNVAAAAAAATIVPLTLLAGGDWREGLLVWAAPIVAALLCWSIILTRPRAGIVRGDAGLGNGGMAILRGRRLPVRDIVIFTASQSVIYYCMLSWLPSIFQSHGEPAAYAGLLLSVATVVGAPIALVVPALAARMEDQRILVLGAVACAATGLLGLLFDPVGAPMLWAVLLGIGQGAAFALALAFFALKTTSSAQTASLSTVAQTVAYLVAALGPFCLGLLHDGSGTWAPGIALLLGCLVAECIAGLRAARARSA